MSHGAEPSFGQRGLQFSPESMLRTSPHQAHCECISGLEHVLRERDQGGLVWRPELPEVTVDWDSPKRAERVGVVSPTSFPRVGSGH